MPSAVAFRCDEDTRYSTCLERLDVLYNDPVRASPEGVRPHRTHRTPADAAPLTRDGGLQVKYTICRVNGVLGT